jgi:hypothetical protein
MEHAASLALRAFTTLGILHAGTGDYGLDFLRLLSMDNLTPHRRGIILALYSCGLTEHAISTAITAVNGVLASLPSPSECDAETLRRLLILKSDTDELFPLVDSLCTALVEAGIFQSSDDGYFTPAIVSTVRAPEDEAGPAGRVPVIIQPTFAVFTSPSLSFKDGVFLAKVARFVKLGTFPEYELTRESVVRAFAEGITGTVLRATLEGLSGTPLPENVSFSIDSWFREYESIRLDRGIVLCVADPFRAMVEHAEGIAPLFRRILAPGVYLFDEAEEKNLRTLLEKAGIACVLPPSRHPASKPMPSHESQGGVTGTDPVESHESTASGISFPVGIYHDREGVSRNPIQPINFPDEAAQASESSVPGEGTSSSVGLRKRFEEALLGMNLGREPTEELRARIDRKLILSEEQLRDGAVRTERLEARALDFAGKVRIIESTLRHANDALEVVSRGARGNPERRLLKPVALDKSGGELVLAAKVLPGGEDVRLYVGKLSLVRRIRSSLL